MAERTRIGDLLVAAGLITEDQVRRTLASQKVSGRRFGEELVALGFVNEVQVTQMLSNQLSVPWVSLYHIEFTRDLLSLLPAEVAQRFCIVPVYVRRVRQDGDTLYVAMDDPTNEEALLFVRDATGLPVRAMVAPPSEIRDAIGVYYFGEAPRASRVIHDDDDAKTDRRPALIDLHNEAKRVGTPSLASDPFVAPPVASRDTEVAEAREPPTESNARVDATREPNAVVAESEPVTPQVAEAPAPRAQDAEVTSPAVAVTAPPTPAARERPKSEAKRRSGGPKMLTLTLLDGTTVRLPQPPEKVEEAEPRPHEHGLTAKDLVQALKARAEGQDMSAVLPNAQWEPLFAALLSLLVRKGVVADWEFVDEWKKLTR